MKEKITVTVDLDVLMDFDDMIYERISKRSTMLNEMMKQEVQKYRGCGQNGNIA